MKNRYLIRAGKYFLFLLLLFVLLYGAMISLGQTSWYILAQRIWLALGAIVLLSLAYPFFGFVTRSVRATKKLDRAEVVRVMAINGFVPVQETEESIVFRPDNFAGKLRMFFEDEITVTFAGSEIVVSGIRREVVRAIYRMNSFK